MELTYLVHGMESWSPYPKLCYSGCYIVQFQVNFLLLCQVSTDGFLICMDVS